MSPRSFAALLEASEEVYRRTFGVLASVIANAHRDPARDAFQPSDFYPAGAEEQTPDDHASVLDQLVDGPPVEATEGR